MPLEQMGFRNVLNPRMLMDPSNEQSNYEINLKTSRCPNKKKPQPSWGCGYQLYSKENYAATYFPAFSITHEI